jgi:Virulence-associated protein E
MRSRLHALARPCLEMTPPRSQGCSRPSRLGGYNCIAVGVWSVCVASPHELLQWYTQIGFRLLFWERRGKDPKAWKGPRDVGWNSRDRVYPLDSYRDTMNVGTFTGHEIQSGRYLADVDFDWDSPNELKKRLLPTTGFGFGRPSRFLSHAFYTTPHQLPAVKKYVDLSNHVIVELYGGDSSEQTMIPPSLHSPGELLEFRNQGDIGHTESLATAVRDYAIGCLLYQHFGHRQLLHEPRLALAGFLLSEGLSESSVLDITKVICQHTGNDPDGQDVERSVRSTASKLRSGERVLGSGALAKVFGDEGVKIVGRIKRWIGDSDFAVSDKGKIYADSQENIRVALEKLNISMSYNQFSQKMYLQNGGPPVLFEDKVMVPTWLQIDERFKFRPSQHFFEQVVKDAAWKNSYHPVLDYLATLTWDGTPRIDRWLLSYGGAVDTEYTRAVGALVLVAAVRRVRRPGCKFDEMLVLESPQQGVLKSTALRVLCPQDEWFSDDLPLGADAKQIIERTTGKWIIEASELHGSHQREAEHLKSFLSRQVDGPVRMAYDRLATEVPRQFIIIGTTNSVTGYLKDFSGARRFWPVRIERFDVETLRRDRDQLWAEAMQREAELPSIRLPEQLYALAATQQEERRLIDPWEEYLQDSDIDLTAPYIEASLVWDVLQLVAANQRDNRHASRLAEIMQRFGYTKKRKMWIESDGGKKCVMCWTREGDAQQEDLLS